MTPTKAPPAFSLPTSKRQYTPAQKARRKELERARRLKKNANEELTAQPITHNLSNNPSTATPPSVHVPTQKKQQYTPAQKERRNELRRIRREKERHRKQHNEVQRLKENEKSRNKHHLDKFLKAMKDLQNDDGELTEKQKAALDVYNKRVNDAAEGRKAKDKVMTDYNSNVDKIMTNVDKIMTGYNSNIADYNKNTDKMMTEYGANVAEFHKNSEKDSARLSETADMVLEMLSPNSKPKKAPAASPAVGTGANLFNCPPAPCDENTDPAAAAFLSGATTTPAPADSVRNDLLSGAPVPAVGDIFGLGVSDSTPAPAPAPTATNPSRLVFGSPTPAPTAFTFGASPSTGGATLGSPTPAPAPTVFATSGATRPSVAPDAPSIWAASGSGSTSLGTSITFGSAATVSAAPSFSFGGVAMSSPADAGAGGFNLGTTEKKLAKKSRPTLEDRRAKFKSTGTTSAKGKKPKFGKDVSSPDAAWRSNNRMKE